jgi:23S rRNA pseudouridine955/2504/2580 synthase
MITIKAGKNESGQRFDKLLMKLLKEAPSSFVYKMLRKKNITLNGKKAEGKEKVEEGDEITFFLSDETYEKFSGKGGQKTDMPAGPAVSDKEIVYEDEDIIIVNKPVGELSQKAKEDDISLNERVLNYLSKKGIGQNEAFTPGVCNRIDRNTSGLVIAGKSLAGLQEASRLLKSHDLKKFYLCSAVGEIKKNMKVEAWILKDEKTNKVTVFDEKKEGCEKIEAEIIPLIQGKEASLLAVRLITGKTHQIRAQLSYLGHPLVGDVKYGYKKREGIKVNHQLLHAFMLVFPENTGKLPELSKKTVSCLPPAEFSDTVKLFFKEEDYDNAIMEFKRTQGFQP